MSWQRLTIVVAVLGLLLTACGPGEPVVVDDEPIDDPVEEPTDEPPAEPVDADTLIVAISAEPDHFDPLHTTASPSFLVLENVYDTLIEPDPDLVFQPALARDWTVSDDALTWTFFLREGVTFHNGREFDAQDVIFNLERLMAEDSPRAWRYETVEEVVAVDDYTVEIRLSAPTPNLLADLGGFKGFAIVPREILEDETIRQTPIGTGAFRFVSYTPGDRVVLEANPDYWGDGPHVERVEFRFISEPTVAITSLLTGEAHLTNNVPPQEITVLEEDDRATVGRVPSIDYWYYTFNQEREPFDDLRVRQALAFAIDREAVTQAAMFDAARPNQTPMPEGSFWHVDHAPYSYDPDRARDLLDEAGVEDLTVDLMLTDEFPPTIQAAQVIVSQWADIGVQAEIRTLDFASWLDEQGQGNFDSFLLGWLNNLDPQYAYYAQHHCEGVFNFQGYCNPEVDELLEQARAELDQDVRRELYEQVARSIVDEASYIYLYNPDIVHAWQPGLQGYEVHPGGTIRLTDVRLGG